MSLCAAWREWFYSITVRAFYFVIACAFLLLLRARFNFVIPHAVAEFSFIIFPPTLTLPLKGEREKLNADPLLKGEGKAEC